MNYKVEKCDFSINKSTSTKDFINTIINIKFRLISSMTFRISRFVGKGSIGNVFLLKIIKTENCDYNDKNKLFVIKISYKNTVSDLTDEYECIKNNFKKYNIIHDYYPLFFGEIKELKTVAIILPFLGLYNFDTIKDINFNINFSTNINLIRQLIRQLKKFNDKNLIHCDLKSANLVIDIKSNLDGTQKIKLSIIDFGLLKEIDDKENIISTSYITSPESLLTLSNYDELIYLEDFQEINLLKHDYFGLFSIIIGLFVKNNYWDIFYNYLVKTCNVSTEYIQSFKAIELFVYVWYKFTHKNIKEVSNSSLIEIIKYIEKKSPKIKEKVILNYEEFFNTYIVPEINTSILDKTKFDDLYNFTKEIIHFDYNKRPSLNDLLNHPFLFVNNYDEEELKLIKQEEDDIKRQEEELLRKKEEEIIKIECEKMKIEDEITIQYNLEKKEIKELNECDRRMMELIKIQELRKLKSKETNESKE